MISKLKLRLLCLLTAAVLLCAGILPTSAETVQEEAPVIGSQYAVIFNADANGEILYGKNEDLPELAFNNVGELTALIGE